VGVEVEEELKRRCIGSPDRLALAWNYLDVFCNRICVSPSSFESGKTGRVFI